MKPTFALLAGAVMAAFVAGCAQGAPAASVSMPY